jgi:hypothetical protein
MDGLDSTNAEVTQVKLIIGAEYDMRGPDDVVFGIGAGCEGAMLVLLERARPAVRGKKCEPHRNKDGRVKYGIDLALKSHRRAPEL